MITDEIFQAFLDCETKSFLQGSGAIGDRREFSNWKRSLAIEHMRKCCIGLRSLFREDEWLSGVPLTQILDDAKCRLAIDCFAQSSDVQSHIHALERLTASGKTWPLAYVPIRFVHHEKITRYDKLLLAFDALAISGNDNKITSVGKIIYGSKQTAVIVKVDALIEETQAIVRRISAQQSSQISPQLILNKHCPECEFQRRCHQIAIEKDELSLLSGMSGTERKKQHDKGIFTVSQLSYTFHARRKPKQSSSNPEKYNHALRARAIRDQKIYISGSPDLRIQGNAVYFDVEGIPDRDSYYLIGIRVRSGDAYVQYSFWSDEEERESNMDLVP